ncbi:MAG: hypothetical protein M3137_15375 [Actinomycetota bacterium]|nr:hypothetical protein [Actinomycetota bacterium]
MSFIAYGYALTGLPSELGGVDDAAHPSHRRTLAFACTHRSEASVSESSLVETESSLTVAWPGYGEFVVRFDRSPELDVARNDVDELEAAICCCQSALPMALPLLGLEPLHASAVATFAGALLLVGPSGSGKTTLATTLLGRGHALVADDACAFDDDGRLWPGPPLMNLRPDAAAGRVAGKVVGPYNEKLAMMPTRWCPAPTGVAAVVMLEPEPGTDLIFRALSAREALPAVLAHVRTPSVFVDRRRSAQLRLAARLSTGHVATMSYDQGRHSASETVDAILAGLAGCVPTPAQGSAST